MSDFISASDLLDSRNLAGQRQLRDELFTIEQSIKQTMDGGLSTEEIGPARKVYDAARAAGAIWDTLA